MMKQIDQLKYMNNLIKQIIIRILITVIILFVSYPINTAQTLQNNICSKSTGDNIVVTKAVAPTYPPLAALAKVSGEVNILITIDQQGNVTTINNIDGHPLLKKFTEACIKLWKFKAIDTNSIQIPIKFVFTLNQETDANNNTSAVFSIPLQVEIRGVPIEQKSTSNIDIFPASNRHKKKNLTKH